VGSEVLTVRGDDFGAGVVMPKVTVGGYNCSDVEMNPSWLHVELTCLTPPGQGKNLPLVVEVDGQRSNSDKM